MNEEELSEGTCSSQRGVDTSQLKPKSVGTTLRQTQSCKHVFLLRANRQYHLNTITTNTHTHLDGRVHVLKTDAPRNKAPPTFCFASPSLSDLLLFETPVSPRVGLYLCRSNGKFYPSVVVCAATTDDGKQIFHSFSHAGTPKQGPCNFAKRRCMERLLRCSLIWLPGQRNVSRRSREFGMVFYDMVPPWSVALGSEWEEQHH